MAIPVPIEARLIHIVPRRIPVAPCTADASVAKRVHKAPVLLLWSSKKAISWVNKTQAKLMAPELKLSILLYIYGHNYVESG